MHVLELSDPPQFLDGDTCRHFVGKHGYQPSLFGGGVGEVGEGGAEERHVSPFSEVLNTSTRPPLG